MLCTACGPRTYEYACVGQLGTHHLEVALRFEPGNKRLFLEMIAGTNAVASHSFYRFGGRLRGVLAGARGTWAGVVLGHKTAVLAKLPQAGQPCCGNLSKSTVR